MKNELSTKVESVSFRGHSGSVLCMDYKSTVLLSGSEDKTARLWDLREKNNNLRASLCMVASDEVTSVAFGPSSEKGEVAGEKIVSPFSRDYSVYLGFDNQVWNYDLRMATTPILKQEKYAESILQSNDEINQIVLSEQRRWGNKNKNNSDASYFLAAGDDTGKIQILDLALQSQQRQQQKQPQPEQQKQTKKQNRQRKGKHQPSISQLIRVLDHDNNTGNMAMVTSCVFRPHAPKGLELASGGTDCTIQLWDINKPKRPLSSYGITPDTATEENNNQLCNPPMVHFLSWSSNGKLLAAGLGDGSCGILSVENRSLVMVGRFQACDSGVPVASVVFQPANDSIASATTYSRHNNTSESHNNDAFARGQVGLPKGEGNGTDNSSTSNNFGSRLLCCAGNDGNVAVWDLGSVIVEGDEFLSSEQSMSHDTNHTSPNRILEIEHGQKANWMVCSSRTEPAFPSTLFVADTTNHITAYTIPL